jgi:hypothetical protein
MTKYRIFAAIFLAAVALQALGCGSGSMMNSNRVLQSMTISPAMPDAQNFANGQVQFTATGVFNKPPSPQQVTFQPPYSGGWSLLATTGPLPATISQTGLAQCIQGASGTAFVVATASANAAMGTGATGVAVRATATLTCP